jgi:protein TonB
MKTILVFCISLLSFAGLYAQKLPPAADTGKVFTFVQQKPQFPGDIYKWLSDNIQYPEDAHKNNIQGAVYVSFIVEKNGSVSGIKVLRGVQGGSSLENEAVRVVSIMPAWTPGMQNGHPVRVSYMLPIHFTLSNSNPSNQNKN